MRTTQLRQLATAVVLLLSLSPALAHSFEAPAVIQAEPDGTFESFAVFTASEDIILGGYDVIGAGNVIAGLIVDCLCPPDPDAGCPVAAGETFGLLIDGTLIDPTSEGLVNVSVFSCDGPNFDAVVRIVPAGQCMTDADCDDGLFCNGSESCAPDTGNCQATSACAPFADGCIVRNGTCSESDDRCQDVVDDSLCPSGYVCQPNGECEEKLFVSLETFSATIEPDGVHLTWETGAEIDNLGFRVLRVASRHAPHLEMLTPRLIHAKGGALSGARYEYLDTTAPETGTVQYYLQDMDVYGRAGLHGPVTIRLGPQSSGRRAPYVRISR